MNNHQLKKLLGFLLLSVIWYGIFSVVFFTFNPQEWSDACRTIYLIGAFFACLNSFE